MHTCKQCGQTLDKSMFYASKTCKGGIRPVCKKCVSTATREYRVKNADVCRERSRKYREENREAKLLRDRAYYAANKDKCRAVNRQWYEANKEANKAYVKQWQAENVEKVAEYKRRNKLSRPETVKAEYTKNRPAYFARAAERRALKTARTPEWADKEVIAEYYRAVEGLNKYFGDGMFHVYHIVPLKSKRVSGLHTDANLQVLLGKTNIAKGNRSWPNM